MRKTGPGLSRSLCPFRGRNRYENRHSLLVTKKDMEDSGTIHLGLVPLTFVVWTCHLLNLLRVAVQPHPELFYP